MMKRFSARFVSFLLILNLLSLSMPAAPETIRRESSSAWQDVRFMLLSSGYDKLGQKILGLFTATRSGKERPISRIGIFPGSVTVPTNVETVFTATAFDSNDEPIGGVEFQWTVRDAETKEEQAIFVDSAFKSARAGTFVLTASADNQEVSETITVVESTDESRGTVEEFEISSRSGRVKREKKGDRDIAQRSLAPGEEWDDTNWLSSDDPGNLPGNPPGMPVDGGAGNGNFQFSAPVISLPGRGIDLALNLNYNSRVWNKSGSNISFDLDYDKPAPGWSLGFGRMIFMGASGGCMLVDADGTRRGYGGTVNSWSTGMSFKGYTTDGGFIDYNCNFIYGNSGSGTSRLPNGTTITYSLITNSGGILQPTKIQDAQGNYITITYRNLPGNALIDVVKDTMGRDIKFNYDNLDRLISVTGPRMDDQDPVHGNASTRTLIKLHYKSHTLGYSFAYGTNPIVRNGTVWVIDSIYYPGTNTGYWFNDSDSYSSYGMITKVVEQRDMTWDPSSEAQGIINAGTMTKKAEYNYPLTAANVSGRTNGVGLTNAPTYDSLKEDWDGMDVAGPVETRYKILMNSSPRVTNVIQPNGSVTKQLSHYSPGNFNDGLVFQDETYVPDSAGTYTFIDLGLTGNFKLAAKSSVTWQAGNYDTPRPSFTEVWDENNHKVSTQYTYNTTASGRFNQILKSCDYDNAGAKLKCAVAEYENGTQYTGYFDSNSKYVSGRHIFNLIKSTGIENPDGTMASLTRYEYDNYTNNPLSNTPGVIQHAASHNPYNTSTYACNCGWSCDFLLRSKKLGKKVEAPAKGDDTPIMMAPPDCEDGSPPWWVCEQCPVYQSDTTFRGNVTKITTYVDAESETGPIEEKRSYDITGNVTKISSSCCEERSFLYDDPSVPGYETQYAYPVSETHGASNPNSTSDRNTSTTKYSYNSGLVTESIDANGLMTKTFYLPDSVRPEKIVFSTLAYTEFVYDDNAMTVTEEVFEIKTSGPLTAGKSRKYLNGVGQVRKQESFAPNSIIDIVETKYTRFGEVWRQSRPYRSGDPIYWTENVYDNQRRLVKVVELDDHFDPTGTETKAFYNEAGAPNSTADAPGNKIRVVDAWGRERWGRYDQQGRLVEVVEPNPSASVNPTGSLSASGNLLTKYSYDTLGRLIQTEQGSQFRKFKYDSLGRLTHQKLAEQTATLSDLGAYVPAGQSGRNWSEVFEYDSRSNLIKKTDPRGVRTLFSYQLSGGGLDPLNRIQSRTFDTSGQLEPNLPINNYAGSVVSYEYMADGDKTRIKKIRSSYILTEDYSYDSQARVSEYKQTIDGRENLPLTVSYLYDSLDRVKEITYPDQYDLTNGSRKIVKHTYDTASRLESLTYGTITSQTQQAGNIEYNASDQTTEIKIGTGTNQVTEQYTFDPQTGLLTDQTATMGGSTVLNLSYEYNRHNSVGSLNGKTGHLTKIIDKQNANRNREYEFDALGRLMKAKGGSTGTLWSQTYTYDRYGNRTNVTASGTAADSSPIPLDGIPNLSYDDATNQITTSGYEYDVAGNLIKGIAEDGVTELKYEYDAANRLHAIRKNDTNQTLVQAFQFGSTNSKLIDYRPTTTGFNYFYCSVGGTVMAEYTEIYGVFAWTKSYTYLGNTQLATITPNGGEQVEFNHPDRLGTRVKTNQSTGTSKEQVHLPFGTALNAESTLTDNNKRFTSYDRSPSTGLDYAMNRTYDSKLGRFTQVDPIGMQSTSLASPQSLNLYSYCLNDSVNYTDPSGLFLGSFFRWLGRAIMSLFSSGVARRIAVRFVVSYVTSGFNLGVAIRSVVPEILAQLGLSPNLLTTPSWNPNLPYPVTLGGVGSLSQYIIYNLQHTSDELIKLAFTKFGPQMAACLKKYYKKWLLRQKFSSARARQTALNNVDKMTIDAKNWGFGVDATLPAATAWKKAGGTGKVPQAFADPALYYHSKYTVVISKETWNSDGHWKDGTFPQMPGRTAMENAYVHEWGNLASHWLTGSASSFGDSNDKVDTDSGRVISKCVFGPAGEWW